MALLIFGADGESLAVSQSSSPSKQRFGLGRSDHWDARRPAQHSLPGDTDVAAEGYDAYAQPFSY